MWFFLALWGFVKAVVNAFRDPELRTLVILTGGLIFGGAAFYHRVEGLRWIDAFYFCVVTLTTVGYGDFSPQTDLGKIFTMVYLLIGLGILAGFIGIIANQAMTANPPLAFLRRSRPASSPDNDPEDEPHQG